jgi:acetyl esterase/lipase
MEATTDVVALHAHLTAAKRAMIAANTSSIEESPVREDDRQIAMRDSESITIRIYASKDTPVDGSPVLVMYPGGGHFLGDLENEALLCRKWVAECGGVSVNVGYRLAPEHPFPVGVNDAFDALKWVWLFINQVFGRIIG